MEWVKLVATPAYYHDGSLLRAGEAAEVLFCRALAHCGNVESGGLVDKSVVPLLAPRSGARAKALVREGLWIDEGTHYRIRSWDKWQDEHDAAAERRRKDRDRKRDARRTVRGQSADSPRDVSGESAESPALDRDVDRESPTDSARPRSSDPSAFDAWYFAYPRKVGKDAARKAYAKAVKRVAPEVLLAAVQRYANDPNLPDAQFTPHPSTWLNEGRWDDEPLPARSRPMTPADRLAAWQASDDYDPSKEWMHQ